MLRPAAVLLALLATAPAATAPAPKPSGAAEARPLHAIFDQEWEYTLAQWPDFATDVGDSRYNDRLPDLSEAAVEARRAHARDLVRRLQGIARAGLPVEDQLDYDLFRYRAERTAEALAYPDEWLQIDQMGGTYSAVAELARQVPRRTLQDYEDFIKRLRAVPAYVDQSIALLRKGSAAGVTPARVTLREVAGLIDNQIAEDVTRMPIYDVVFRPDFPTSIPAAEQERVRQAGALALRESVLPAYRKLRAFFVDDYYPKTRTSTGWSDLPNGAAWYQVRVHEQTTTTLTPDEIHAIGLSEVRRIRTEMEKAKDEAGFKGTLAEFGQFLRTDPRFFFADREAMLVAYRDIAKRIDPELPKLFGTLPRLPYGVQPVPSYSEKTQPGGYYSEGSAETGRAGQVYVNLYDLPSRPKWDMEALMAHEGVPGHHLQIALAQELVGLPKFRRFGGNNAYVEGWALYSESLGAELGLYKDPYSRFGQLNSEVWRAIRLVVDTGLHAKGWTREQAIAFFRENSGSTLQDITVEVDRYLVWPGQALGYKLGELKIKELRAYATHELGDRFDLRKFHDVVLGAGALPLGTLEARVREWVGQEKISGS
jgi:uncharacterized protein (DUF885 family)